MDFTSLALQLLGGLGGGNAAGKALPNLDLGPLGNSITGAAGGIAGGQLLQVLIPALSGAGGVDVGTLAGNFFGGGVTGAIVTALVGYVMQTIGGPRKA